MTDDLSDDSFGMFAKIWIQEIIVLAYAVIPRREFAGIGWIIRIVERRGGPSMSNQDFRMLFIKPCRNGIGGCAQNGFDAGLVQAIEHALHPRELKLAIAQLPAAPGGLPDPNDSDSRFLHQLNIFVETIVRHILRVVSDTV